MVSGTNARNHNEGGPLKVTTIPSSLSMQTTGIVALYAALALVVVCGCSSDLQQDRCEVTGEVTLDDSPLSSGAITLRPLRNGQTAGATIHDGKFTITGERAPKFGKYRVEIEAYLPTGKKIPDPDIPGAMTEEIKQILPRRYNRRSEQEIDITPDSDRHLTFDLKSK